MKNKLLNILAYIGPLYMFGIFKINTNERIAFHVNQGIVLLLFGAGAVASCSIIAFFVAYLPLIGSPLSAILRIFAWSFWLFLALVGIKNAIKDTPKPLPLIGNISLLNPKSS